MIATEDERAGRGAGKASSRRRLLARGRRSASVFTAEALARPAPAAADNGNPVILGTTNTENAATIIMNSVASMPRSSATALDSPQAFTVIASTAPA